MTTSVTSPASSIVQVSISHGGVPKLPIDVAHLGRLGLAGDVQKHTKIHGGPDRAVCLYSMEVIEQLQREGHPVVPGALGENLTVRGLPWDTLEVGTCLALGTEAVIELTRIASPCKQIRAAFSDKKFNRVAEPRWGRWYARVLHEGVVRVGMSVARLAESPKRRAVSVAVAQSLDAG